ncbi:uncharacterized protein [Nicotiana tomentosiformis]|uniref:uncharacterized protein n=1 Tax=Nicotiana tomentosiformis TaxID=4098 RepID=UPI00388C57A7
MLFSDHSPLSATLEDRTEQVAMSFKLYNYLADHPEFMAIVETTWSRPDNSIPMVKVWKKLQKLKVELKKLNKKEFSGLSDKVKKTKEKLQVLQSQMRQIPNHQIMFEEEKVLKLELEKWGLIDENVARQKATVQWLKLGYSNTSYFHACLKNMIAQNQIRNLVTADRDILQNKNSIEAEIIEFYE